MWLALAFVLSSCAIYPSDPSRQGAFHVDRARDAAQKGDGNTFLDQSLTAISRPGGAEQLRSLISSSEQAKTLMLGSLGRRVDSFSTPKEAFDLQNSLTSIRTAGVLPPHEVSALEQQLSVRVVRHNADGKIPFTFDDSPDFFPMLMRPENEAIVLRNTIQALRAPSRDSRAGLLGSLRDYLKRRSNDTPAHAQVKALLPTLNIRRSELPVVIEIDPQFAAARERDMSLRVALTVKAGDRLFRDDIENLVRRSIKGMELVPHDQSPQLTVVIERLRYEERREPERSQTISYQQHEVNLLAAALLMPRNASYLYEHVSGISEIEYGYAVLASNASGVVADTVVRGKVGGPYSRCQHERIQNVFGGANRATFIANDDMQRRCSTSSAELSLDALRTQAQEKLVEALLQIPPLRAVDELNR